MPLTRSANLRFIRLAIGGIIAALIIAYAVWRSLDYVRGPVIDVWSPIDGSGIASSTVTITGQALRVNNLGLNGDAISVDEKGDFSQTIVIFPGMNIITLTASDQFGRSTKKELDLVGLDAFPARNTNTAGISSTTGQ
jgi:hypothetical protein